MSRTVTLALAGAFAPLAVGAVALVGGMSADAATEGDQVIFDGRGFGHGVGMSQYGARGRALAGWDHPRILAHYYPGTTLRAVPPRTIRVLLDERTDSVAVTSARPWRAVGRTVRGGRVLPLPAGDVHQARPLPGGRVVIEHAGRRVAAFTGAVRFETTARGGVISWGAEAPEHGKRYRGALRVGPAEGGGLRVANIVRIEDYLRGVVPEEMPPSWGDRAPAALRAQAVAARSYALATLRRGSDFEVYDDTRSQVYGGVAAEDARTTRAVALTRGAVLMVDGAIATTYFHSTSGGRTEAAHKAWPGSPPRAYLVSVADPFDAASPLHTWTWRVDADRAGTLLGLGAPVRSIEVLERGDSPRVLRARVTTTAGRRVELTGAEMRARLGLHDTWFDVRVGR